MPITTPTHWFTKQEVDQAPASAGVYCLYNPTGTPSYYGRAQGGSVTIRTRLQSHQRGDEGPCTKAASFFNSEVCSDPVTRERQLLEEHRRVYGRLPQCNEVMP